jgi:hypothetical protein
LYPTAFLTDTSVGTAPQGGAARGSADVSVTREREQRPAAPLALGPYRYSSEIPPGEPLRRDSAPYIAPKPGPGQRNGDLSSSRAGIDAAESLGGQASTAMGGSFMYIGGGIIGLIILILIILLLMGRL